MQSAIATCLPSWTLIQWRFSLTRLILTMIMPLLLITKKKMSMKMPSHASSKEDITSRNSGAPSLNPNDVPPNLTEAGDEKKHGQETKGKENQKKKMSKMVQYTLVHMLPLLVDLLHCPHTLLLTLVTNTTIP